MGVPNLRALREHANATINRGATIVCVCCNRPLWKVEILGQYGTRFKTKETPFPGVPEYSEYFDKAMNCYQQDCPFCGHVWFNLIMNSDGQKIAQPKTVEWGI